MAHVFQTELPTAEGAAIAKAILSHQFKASMIRDAWVVAEYGVSQFTPGTQPAMAQAAGPEQERQAMQSLAAYCGEDHSARAQFLPVPWGIVLSVVLKAILAVL